MQSIISILSAIPLSIYISYVLAHKVIRYDPTLNEGPVLLVVIAVSGIVALLAISFTIYTLCVKRSLLFLLFVGIFFISLPVIFSIIFPSTNPLYDNDAVFKRAIDGKNIALCEKIFLKNLKQECYSKILQYP